MTSKKFIKSAIIDFTEIFVIGIAVFVLAWLFLAEPLEVAGESMTPTLNNKEQIIAEKLSMNFGELERGDIIVFNSPENKNMLLIKRIVALPGEKFSIKNNEIYINGEKYEETYLKSDENTEGSKSIKNGDSITVPQDSYVLLGDNREKSKDSREFGPIKKSEIIGKAVFVFYPLENLRVINNIDSLFPASVINKVDGS